MVAEKQLETNLEYAEREAFLEGSDRMLKFCRLLSHGIHQMALGIFLLLTIRPWAIDRVRMENLLCWPSCSLPLTIDSSCYHR